MALSAARPKVASRKRRCCGRVGWLLVFPCILAATLSDQFAKILAALLFTRPGSQSCVPPEELGLGSASPLRPLTEEEIAAFERDGSVILPGILDAVWLERLHALASDVFKHPNTWDVIYSRLIANFYCAQKSILLHHTSVCGRELAESAPTTAIAAALLRSTTLQVCEPTEGLANFRKPSGWFATSLGISQTCGTTGFHTDDAYIPVGRRDPSRAAVVRLWMPLTNFTSRHFRFAALNESSAARAERAAAGLEALHGTSYRKDALLEDSGVLSRPGQVLEAGEMRPGDILAFSGETAHSATALDCDDPSVGGCLRLILSFSGDNAVFVGGRSTGLIPLHDNQTEGERPGGVQFPTVFPDATAAPWEWQPLEPSVHTLAAAIWFALSSGTQSFTGYSWRKQLVYIVRVGWYTVVNVWDHPEGALSLVGHFGGSLLGWMGGLATT
jgi:hypothetical protein